MRNEGCKLGEKNTDGNEAKINTETGEKNDVVRRNIFFLGGYNPRLAWTGVKGFIRISRSRRHSIGRAWITKNKESVTTSVTEQRRGRI